MKTNLAVTIIDAMLALPPSAVECRQDSPYHLFRVRPKTAKASSVESKSKAAKSSSSMSLLSSKVMKQAKSKCVQSLPLSQSFSYSMPSMSLLSSKVGKQAKSKCVQSLSLSQSFSYSMPSMSISTKSSKVGSKASRRSSGKSSKSGSGSHGDKTDLAGSSISSKTSKCVEPSVHSPAPVVARDDIFSVLSTTNGTRT